MKIRAVAAAALALAIGVGLTGCNMISPQRTEMQYDASDGVSADLGGVSVQNALLLTTESVDEANFVFTAVNLTNAEATVTAQVGASSVEKTIDHTINNRLVKVGFGESGSEIVSGDFVSGSTFEVTFTSTYTDDEGNTQTAEQTVIVPVLGSEIAEGVLGEYATLLPEATEPGFTETEETIEEEVGEDEGEQEQLDTEIQP
ncbi:hypothetical protein [Gulosibacter chungangensis]|uniref:DNA modification methylase n=1 Tax=Gulosibacter chungangensis TaxID=979746 RepID=A0A7J5BAP2_9MICO|nr:hypothetical protein [Gulosibacter chungangensis]KAB1643094.1 hypothetical protein F8O05_07555 [Gulosibacter chungangensis]